jgi:hypothetical protein
VALRHKGKFTNDRVEGRVCYEGSGDEELMDVSGDVGKFVGTGCCLDAGLGG